MTAETVATRVLDAASVVKLFAILAEIAGIIFEAVGAKVFFAGVMKRDDIERNAFTPTGGAVGLLLVLLVGLAGGDA